MAWIESHDDVADHVKTQMLCSQLKISVPTAVGHLHLLWHYTLKVSWQTGDLSGHFPHTIARACHWEGSAEDFIKALQDCKYLVGMKIHDWGIYARELIYQKTYNKNKRLKSVVTASLQHTNSGKTPLPNLTIPNLTKPKKEEAFFNQLDAFNSIASKYPKQIGSSAAMRFFFQTVISEEKFQLFNQAFDNYISSNRVKEGYAKDFDKWIVDWSDWIDYKEPKKLNAEQLKIKKQREEVLGVRK